MTDEQCIGIMAAILMASVEQYPAGQKPTVVEAKAAVKLWREVHNQLTEPQWTPEEAENEPIPIGP